MNCPNCFLEQPRGKEKCPRCGVIFAKWENFKSSTPNPGFRPVHQPPTAKTLLRSSNKPLPPALLLLKILCLIAVIGGWYWFLVPSSRLSIPPKAYKDELNAFALSIPPDWKGGKVKNCGGPNKSCEVFAASRQGSSGRFTPSFNVVVLEFKNLPSLFSRGPVLFTESNKDESAKEVLKGIEGVVNSFQLKNTAVVQVDAIPSLLIEGAGTYAGQIFWSVFTLIPGSSKLYLLSYIGLTADSSDLDGLIQSFRVLERHPSLFNLYGGLWGSLRGDLILGFLIGFTLMTFRLISWSKK